MPLKPGKSKAAFGHNVKAEMHAGKPQRQALAIAYNEARKRKMFSGGTVENHENSQEESGDDEWSDMENEFLVADEPEDVNEQPPGNTDGGADVDRLLEMLKRKLKR